MVLSIKDTSLEFVLLAKNGQFAKELPLSQLLTVHTWYTSWMNRMTDGDWKNLPGQDKPVPLKSALLVNRSVRYHRPVARMMDALMVQKTIGDCQVAVSLSSPKFCKLLISCASEFQVIYFSFSGPGRVEEYTFYVTILLSLSKKPLDVVFLLFQMNIFEVICTPRHLPIF